jgi:hypothetical protein
MWLLSVLTINGRRVAGKPIVTDKSGKTKHGSTQFNGYSEAFIEAITKVRGALVSQMYMAALPAVLLKKGGCWRNVASLIIREVEEGHSIQVHLYPNYAFPHHHSRSKYGRQFQACFINTCQLNLTFASLWLPLAPLVTQCIASHVGMGATSPTCMLVQGSQVLPGFRAPAMHQPADGSLDSLLSNLQAQQVCQRPYGEFIWCV